MLAGHARIQKVLSGGGGSNFDKVFLVDKGGGGGGKDPNTTIGPPAKRHLNGVSLAGR